MKAEDLRKNAFAMPHHNPSYPEDDMQHQYKYIGVAPEAPAS